MNNILSEDIKYIHSKLDFSRLEGKKILITGATGLIGTAVILSMLEWNKKAKEPIRIIAVVRNADKANKIFGDYDSSEIEYLVSDVCDVEAADMGIDYIIHGAVSTSSKAFVGTPVEIIKTSVIGTINLLELAKKNNVSILSGHDSTAATATLIEYSSPVTAMADKNILPVHASDSVQKIRPLLTKSTSRCLPVVDDNYKVIGVISESDLLHEANIQVILVDHNEPQQAVEGIEQQLVQDLAYEHRYGCS